MVGKWTGEVEVVKLSDHQRVELFGKDVTGDDIDMVNMLYIKDLYNTSGNVYHGMTKSARFAYTAFVHGAIGNGYV